MTVWVDNMRLPARPAGYHGRGTPRWSHLFADSPVELRRFAIRLGLDPLWLQHGGTHREHYDLTDTKRAEALRAGAVPIRYPSGVADLLAVRRRVCRCSTLGGCRWAQLAVSSS